MAEGHDEHGSGQHSYPASTWVVLGAALAAALGLFALRCPLGPDVSRPYPSRSLPPEPEPVLMAGPGLDEEYWPCSDCHEGEEVNFKVRKLEEEHDTLKLEHGQLWCFHCHDPTKRDVLHLADGSPAEFADSWQLCTQCHAKKLPDWRAGVHGKRTGSWWGAKEYRTCVVCHDPHSPAFKPLRPLPPPRPPEEILTGEAGRVEVPQ